MRRRYALAAISVAWLLAQPAGLAAAQLFSVGFDANYGWRALDTDSGVRLAVLTNPFGLDDRPKVSFPRVGESDVGRTLTLTPGTTPGFEEVAARLTDGTGQTVVVLYDMGTPGVAAPTWSEPEFIWGDSRDPRIDLKGFVIDSISMRVDRLSITSPGLDPNHDGLWTSASAHYTFSAEGRSLPEPAAGLTALVGFAPLGLRRRARRVSTQPDHDPRSRMSNRLPSARPDLTAP